MKIEASATDVLRAALRVHGRGRGHRATSSPDSATRIDGNPRSGETDREQVGAEDGRLAPGFRSPATANAIGRFTDLLLGNLEGEERERVEAAINEFVQRAGEISAADARPYGLSVEHDIKQLLRDPEIRKAIRLAHDRPEEDPVVVEPGTPEEPQTVVSEPPSQLPAEAPSSRLDFSA